MKTYLIFAFAIFAVLALSAGGRTILTWLGGLFRPFLGIAVYLLSAHYTILKHLVTSRAIIYPTLARKTVHRDD